MRHAVDFTLLVLLSLMGISCSGSGQVPVAPSSDLQGNTVVIAQAESSTYLWGLYDVYIDVETGTASAVLDRSAMFTANVVKFINGKPANLGFHINGITPGTGYTDIDIDVSITHPFPGLSQYNGYDVRGVFMGDGSGVLGYNTDLKYPVAGTDQFMLADPTDGFGGPDGYTRWFNKPEFSTGGSPLFQYTQGKFASKNFNGTATLCPYKYFTDSLGKDDNYWTWLEGHASEHGIFSAGATNTRNYYLRFPSGKGIAYGYAITANWGGAESQFHPSNAPEAVGCKVVDSSNLYYVNSSQKGGKLKLDISIWDWDSQLSSGVMSDYRILVESTVLTAPYEFSTSEMTPTGGNVFFSTYSVEITPDNLTGTQGNEYWIIAECADENYTNDLGVTNLADTDKLAAFFRYDLSVANAPQNTVPEITGITDDILPPGLNQIVYSTYTAVTYIVNYTDPDVGQTHTIKWYIEPASATSPTDPPDTMPFNWFLKSSGDYKIWVKVSDGIAEAVGGPYLVTRVMSGGWARSWGAAGYYEYPDEVAVDSAGYIYQTGAFMGMVDFDPGPGIELRTSASFPSYINRDCYLSKFDPSGNFMWVRTWGGGVRSDTDDKGQGLAVDSDGNVYVAGYFYGALATDPPVCIPVDFDPGPGEDLYTSNGSYDCFVSKFDTNGNYKWARTWGGPDYGTWPSSYNFGQDEAWGVGVDASGNVYVNGMIYSQFCDFNTNPGGIYIVNNAGPSGGDAFLSKFTSDGIWVWTRNWGGNGSERCWDLWVDPSGNCYSVGGFSYTVDFDPGPGIENRSSVSFFESPYLSKINSSGVFQWVQAWTGNSHAFCTSITGDGLGNVYAGGHFSYNNMSGTMDFDPGLGVFTLMSNGLDECYVTAFYQDKTWLWAKAWGGTASDFLWGIDADANGNVYLSGFYQSAAVDFDPGAGVQNVNNVGSSDAWLLKLDLAGNFLWVRTLGSAQGDAGRGVAVSGMDAVYNVGTFNLTIDFDPDPGSVYNLTTSGPSNYNDAFIVKYLPNGYW